MAGSKIHRKILGKPGTLIGSGQQIVDAKGRIRMLPTNNVRKERFIEAIKRKVETKKDQRTRISLPKTLPKPTLMRILKQMGFKEVPGASPQKFKHPKHGVVHLPSGKGIRTGAISIRRSFWGKIISCYLKQGGKI